jgi:hypothetical protein
MRFEECLDKGLIKEDPLARERVESSLMIAERFLRYSNRNLEINEYEMAEMAACNSAFHVARALLLRAQQFEQCFRRKNLNQVIRPE